MAQSARRASKYVGERIESNLLPKENKKIRRGKTTLFEVTPVAVRNKVQKDVYNPLLEDNGIKTTKIKTGMLEVTENDSTCEDSLRLQVDLHQLKLELELDIKEESGRMALEESCDDDELLSAMEMYRDVPTFRDSPKLRRKDWSAS